MKSIGPPKFYIVEQGVVWFIKECTAEFLLSWTVPLPEDLSIQLLQRTVQGNTAVLLVSLKWPLLFTFAYYQNEKKNHTIYEEVNFESF